MQAMRVVKERSQLVERFWGLQAATRILPMLWPRVHSWNSVS